MTSRSAALHPSAVLESWSNIYAIISQVLYVVLVVAMGSLVKEQSTILVIHGRASSPE